MKVLMAKHNGKAIELSNDFDAIPSWNGNVLHDMDENTAKFIEENLGVSPYDTKSIEYYVVEE